MTRWLKVDAKNRAWRTTLQGILATLVLPALVAAVEVVQRAVVDASGGRALDWSDIRTAALHAAGTAALMAFFAYLHRAKLDPSPIPSAQPPLTDTTSHKHHAILRSQVNYGSTRDLNDRARRKPGHGGVRGPAAMPTYPQPAPPRLGEGRELASRCPSPPSSAHSAPGSPP